MLITTRHHLARLAGAVTLPVNVLRPDDAVALVAGIAGPERPADAAHIEELCGYPPLAVALTSRQLLARTYYEPGTAAIVATVMLIAGDGEWTRRKIGSLEDAIRFGNQRGIPVYEVFRTGYPQRKRDYGEQTRRPKTRG